MYVLGGGQPLLKKGFTLIELLAVLIILAIIALIAIPQVLNIINNSRKKSTEISVQNYLKAVDVAIMNKEVNGEKILNGVYNITDNGKLLDYPDDNLENDINIEFEGQGLTEGIIKIENNKVVNVDTKIDKWYVILNNGIINLKYKQKTSTLILGQLFNQRIKKLANKDEIISYLTEDNVITSIEFYSNGILPSGYTKEKLNLLPNISVSDKNDITAYNDNGQIYIISNNLINFNVSSNDMFYNFRTLREIEFGNIDTSQVNSMRYMFFGCSSIKKLDLNNFDTSQVVEMNNMFQACNKLTELNLSKFITNNVKNMEYMFQGCGSIKKLDLNNFDTSNVINMRAMFAECGNLSNLIIAKFITFNVTDMCWMFSNCSSLVELDVSSFDTSKVINLSQVFLNCSSLISLDLNKWNTSRVTTMQKMFSGCGSLINLYISDWNTSQVTNMSEMFNGCKMLKNLQIINFDVSKVNDIGGMFYNCSNLISLDLSKWDTNEATIMMNMFSGTTNLQTITIGCDWKTAENNGNMFAGSGYTQEQFNTLVEQIQSSCQAT